MQYKMFNVNMNIYKAKMARIDYNSLCILDFTIFKFFGIKVYKTITIFKFFNHFSSKI